MSPMEKKLLQSFSKVKSDMIELQQTISVLTRNQETLMQWIHETRRQMDAKKKPATKTIIKEKTVVKNVTKKAKTVYVAAKSGKKFHKSNCPYAKNIKRDQKVTFKTPNAARKDGYSDCKCVL